MSGFFSGSAARLQSLLASVAGAAAVVFRRAGGVGRTVEAKLSDVFDVRDRGIIVDGVTDQTAALVALWGALQGEGFRGLVNIPYGCKFNPLPVWNAVPVGIELDDASCINWGQPPGYRSNFRVRYRGDAQADDKVEIVASPHHPALMLMNTGAAGTALGNRRGATILHAVGRDVDGDPLLGWLTQYSKDPDTGRWIIQDRLQTPYAVAAANPGHWAPGVVVAAAAYVQSQSTGRVYQVEGAGGLTGVTEPTHAAGTATDGGVTWRFVQSAINIDATRRQLSEDGEMGLYGPPGGTAKLTMQAGDNTLQLVVDDASGDVALRDVSRSLDVLRMSTAAGARMGGVPSAGRVDRAHAGPAALPVVSELTFVTGAGDITDLTLPAGQTSGRVVLWFAASGITLKNNAAIVTRTGADIASAANMMVTLAKDAGVSASWVVVCRN